MRTKSEARRQAIIDTARVVFSEQGFAATSMSAIAAKLGGSKATLYNYFSSKEELFVAIIQQFAAAHLCEVYRLLDAKAPLRATLERFSAGFITVICSPDVTTTRVNMFLERDKSDIGALFYERGPKQGLGIVAEYFQQCIDLGRLRPGNTFLMAQQLFALLKAEGEELILCGIRKSFTAEEIQAMMQRAVDVFLRAYGTGADN
ncbi:TetR/AcrR family transcriptional regulator [Uliginosibacterium gangwonense]|uniref:TetR/AcrR family transcriptional regulator n=1 Tax=Uliginosibacterium gangwonense TaxID=392736 RepID=UPI00036AF272|nr:TetR/AcrR family transcriptional regulator [Uliginosibacterium gangwonense]